MPLDLEAIAQAIHEMAQAFDGDERHERLETALERLRTIDPKLVRDRLDDPQAHPGWLVAYPERTFAKTYPLPPCPTDFTVVAADGSSHGPDRHSPVRFFIINTGYAVITYGSQPAAELDAFSRLYYRDEEVFIEPEHHTLPVEGAILAVKMAVDEMTALVDATTAVAQSEAVALRDGTLILWGLDSPGITPEVRERFLNPYREAMRRLRSLDIPLAAYISYPNADDVINALRVGMCPDLVVICSRCAARRARRRPPCADLAMLVDRFLFARHLADGERSDIFLSRHPVLKYYEDDQKIYFFYLNVGDEVARIEVPAWVARSPALLDRVHAVVYDQCQRGDGYPPALTEAHEQAVISVGERRLIEEMVTRELADRAVVYIRSEKDRSKRLRGV
ncbi:MAG TPA: DNA double-strand break repair nuclease NurA [Caldilineae bacterium]|nr:DNA double-strand break repair nuclease NurA [Caldilineae bacterium]